MRLCSFLLLFWPACLIAQDVEVDVELFLAVDVSRSMSDAELEIQRRGYAAAITSQEVLDAIQNGLLGRIAITYVEWAGEFSQRVIVPWQMVENAQDAASIAQIIANTTDPGLRRTSISSALRYAAADFQDNGFMGLRRVIDVSGDGPNNQGSPVLPARDAVIAQGFTINGLPLMTTDALSNIWGIPDLDVFYLNCVVGGPGAFVVPVYSWDQFAAAVKQKLVLEIAAAPAHDLPPVVSKASAYDCMIGETMWQENRPYFVIP
ncbi:MAG: DUF1194 domain-containing protein [Roseobacter sp.]